MCVYTTGWSAVTTCSNDRWRFCASAWSSRRGARASPRSRSATWSEPKPTQTCATAPCRGRWRCSSRCTESSEGEEEKGGKEEEGACEGGKMRNYGQILDMRGCGDGEPEEIFIQDYSHQKIINQLLTLCLQLCERCLDLSVYFCLF